MGSLDSYHDDVGIGTSCAVITPLDFFGGICVHAHEIPVDPLSVGFFLIMQRNFLLFKTPGKDLTVC